MSQTTKQVPVRVIKAGSKSLFEYLDSVWQFRGLVYTLAVRDLKVQYAQTVLGILWSAIQPLTFLFIFTVFFTQLFQVDTGDIPFNLFAFTGIICWYYFTNIIGHAGTALSSAQDLIKKVYFPKLILPLAKVMVGLAEFAISFGLLVLMMLIQGFVPGPKLLLLPFLLLAIIITGLSVALWLSALTVKYRDFHHLIPYVVNFGIWLTPVFYPTTIVPAEYSFIIHWNPMAALTEGFRWIMLTDQVPSSKYLVSFVPVLFLFVTGLFYFKNVESRISDYV